MSLKNIHSPFYKNFIDICPRKVEHFLTTRLANQHEKTNVNAARRKLYCVPDGYSKYKSQHPFLISTRILLLNNLKHSWYTKYLDLLQNISLHFYCHMIDIVVWAIIHHSILEHQHNVTLKFSCAADQSVFNVFLNSWQIHRPKK